VRRILWEGRNSEAPDSAAKKGLKSPTRRGGQVNKSRQGVPREGGERVVCCITRRERKEEINRVWGARDPPEKKRRPQIDDFKCCTTWRRRGDGSRVGTGGRGMYRCGGRKSGTCSKRGGDREHQCRGNLKQGRGLARPMCQYEPVTVKNGKVTLKNRRRLGKRAIPKRRHLPRCPSGRGPFSSQGPSAGGNSGASRVRWEVLSSVSTGIFGKKGRRLYKSGRASHRPGFERIRGGDPAHRREGGCFRLWEPLKTFEKKEGFRAT